MVELSRNKFFYSDIKLADNFETRVLLIFFHFIIILRLKKDNKLKKNFQDIFDNIFQNIEINIRELGYGDTKVNNTMKNLNKIFYDILYKLDKNNETSFQERLDLLNKYFFNNKKNTDQNTDKLAKYMDQFSDFCFDLNIDNVLKGSIEFEFN